jgi:ABC-type polysaccharide/polyol phosphate transport system ATPase subunit
VPSVISVSHATKRFRYRPHAPGTLTLKSALLDALLFRPRPPRVEVDAVVDATFEVKRGEAIGLVGKNGAGAGGRGKCRARVAELRARGTAVVLASHDLAAVEALCDRALWLDRGRVRAEGPAAEVVRAYRADCA